MRLHLHRLLIALLFTSSMISAPITTPTTNNTRVSTPPYIVLKLDDMVASDGHVPERWQRIIGFAEQRRLKLSIGIVCNSLDGDHPAYFAELKRAAATGLIEFWHHGSDHRQWTENEITYREFSKTSRDHQQDHFDRGVKLAQDKLGLVFTTFGAPFNASDATTTEVLSGAPDIRVWLFGDAKNPAGKFVARRVPATDLEVPVHKPNYTAFVQGYETERIHAHRYHVLQGHPLSWDDQAFAEFVRVIDYLAEQGCTFVHPSELPALIK